MRNVGYQCESKLSKPLLLLIAATFSRCFAVTAAAKGTRTFLWLEKLTQGTTKFITLRPLVAYHSQGLWVINSVDPCVLKSNYYIKLGLASMYKLSLYNDTNHLSVALLNLHIATI